MSHALRLIRLTFVLAALTAVSTARASTPSPAEAAEAMRANLSRAQVVLNSDRPAAQAALAQARAAFAALEAALMQHAPRIATHIREEFTRTEDAVRRGDGVALAAGRAEMWTALLHGSFVIVEGAMDAGDPTTAQAWLPVREYRRATRFSRPNADATLALAHWQRGDVNATDALEAVRADLLDTYQARLNEALGEVARAHQRGFAVRRMESAALAVGYFDILAPSFGDQRGDAALQAAQRQFVALRAAAESGAQLEQALAEVKTTLAGFRAAPLTATEQMRRAGQMLRFLSLVPIEYARGIRNGQVTVDLEIREAITFRDGAAAAFDDLRALLDARDPAQTARAASILEQLEQQLDDASTRAAVADPDAVRAQVEALTAILGQVMPPEWQKQDSAADFDVIRTALDQMEAAVAAGEYALAESARIEAYAILESGPEAKIAAFAPQYKLSLEALFWYGDADNPGLARLLEQRASVRTIKAVRDKLDGELANAQQALVGSNAPAAVATNAAIIVFREGLEAVLILASLMASFRAAAQRHFRRPMWLGTGLALIATIITWLVMRSTISLFARYGEQLEAVVSLIAIGVLLLITNWFFHDVYWTGWMASFHKRKKTLLAEGASQFIGLTVLGFTSIYREGFETALFLQALVLAGDTGSVLLGTLVGLIATLAVGVLVFVLQARLPMKRMLILTGIMIGAVLLVMVGNTVHILQVIGWLPTHPIRALTLPYWFGIWFGTYATWEGLGAQLGAAVFVIGSYFLAERKHKRSVPSRAVPHTP